jgi:D-alanyl-lipoteichoic acid acyltransferase DltB (MBOAT superfamily)
MPQATASSLRWWTSCFRDDGLTVLRIDSLSFVACAVLLILAMRGLGARWGGRAYAALSLAVYLSLAPTLVSAIASLVFLYWPWLVLRGKRPLAPATAPLLVCVQTAFFLWSRKYLALLGGLGELPLFAEAITIIGVSYLILRQVELVVSVDAEPELEVGFVEYTAFGVGLFTLLAGPIMTFADFAATFRAPDKPTPAAQLSALQRVVHGYFKVSLIGPVLFDLATRDTLTSLGFGAGAKAAFFYLYPLYIYANFAGYCDVVIGCGRLCGLTITENFNRPFLAPNIQNYWQRWHITLSAWIRVHIFFPLMRVLRPLGWAGTPLSLLLTFLIVGLWHGPAPGFAVFGMLHGLAVLAVGPYGRLLERLLGPAGMERYLASPTLKVLRVAACYHYVCFTQLFFERPLDSVTLLFK